MRLHVHSQLLPVKGLPSLDRSLGGQGYNDAPKVQLLLSGPSFAAHRVESAVEVVSGGGSPSERVTKGLNDRRRRYCPDPTLDGVIQVQSSAAAAAAEKSVVVELEEKKDREESFIGSRRFDDPWPVTITRLAVNPKECSKAAGGRETVLTWRGLPISGSPHDSRTHSRAIGLGAVRLPRDLTGGRNDFLVILGGSLRLRSLDPF